VNATDLDPAALLDALHAALDADPSDAATRLEMADLLDDRDDRVGARGQRWQALRRRHPSRYPSSSWWWWPATAGGRGADPDDLPGGLFGLLAAGTWVSTATGRYYPSRRAAEADLAQALESLARRAAVLAGYEPDPCPWCGERALVRSGPENACDRGRGGCGRRWVS
jgi:hypothetical protein